MKTFYWDADIGAIYAMAVDVDAARQQIMALLKPNDLARPELKEAISVEPKEVNGPWAVIHFEP